MAWPQYGVELTAGITTGHPEEQKKAEELLKSWEGIAFRHARWLHGSSFFQDFQGKPESATVQCGAPVVNWFISYIISLLTFFKTSSIYLPQVLVTGLRNQLSYLGDTTLQISYCLLVACWQISYWEVGQWFCLFSIVMIQISDTPLNSNVLKQQSLGTCRTQANILRSGQQSIVSDKPWIYV